MSLDRVVFCEKKHKTINFLGVRFSSKTWSRLNFGVLGPENSDSSSKTTYIVLFPGFNSNIQAKIPRFLKLGFCRIRFGNDAAAEPPRRFDREEKGGLSSVRKEKVL